MNVLTQEQINNIRNSVDIVDIISNYIPLTSKGKNFFGVCPFHADHSPSMSVSKEKQIYTCFSCGASGNVFNFLMDYENISFIDAVKYCADKSGIILNIDNQKEIKKDSELYEIYNLAQKFYQNNINTELGKEAKEYLIKRKFDEQLINTFGIGLALNKKDILTKLLINKKYDFNILNKSGLVGKNDSGYYDIYVNRIMFPLYDLTGKIVGYSGRIYNTESTSKYVNTKETEIFKKGELLYNYHRAKDEVRKSNYLIIVEGFMDVIRLYSVGIKNVVATMGTAITKNQALLMKRLSNEIILCFDGDDAGNKATNSCINELEKVGVIPKVIRLEQNLDPDEYIIKYGKNKFLEKINNPINSMDYKMSYYKSGKDLNNNLEMSEYVDNTLKELSKINNETYIELTLNKLSSDSNLSIEYLRNRIKKIDIPVEVKANEKKLSGFEIAERNLTYYILNNEEALKLFIKEKPIIENIEYKNLIEEVILYYNSTHQINLADLITYFKDSNFIKTINKLMILNLKDKNLDQIKGYIDRLNERRIKKEINEIKNELSMEDDPIKKAQILQEIINIKKVDEINDK